MYQPHLNALKPGLGLGVRENTDFMYTPGLGVVWGSTPAPCELGLLGAPTH